MKLEVVNKKDKKVTVIELRVGDVFYYSANLGDYWLVIDPRDTLSDNKVWALSLDQHVLSPFDEDIGVSHVSATVTVKH